MRKVLIRGDNIYYVSYDLNTVFGNISSRNGFESSTLIKFRYISITKSLPKRDFPSYSNKRVELNVYGTLQLRLMLLVADKCL